MKGDIKVPLPWQTRLYVRLMPDMLAGESALVPIVYRAAYCSVNVVRI